MSDGKKVCPIHDYAHVIYDTCKYCDGMRLERITKMKEALKGSGCVTAPETDELKSAVIDDYMCSAYSMWNITDLKDDDT